MICCGSSNDGGRCATTECLLYGNNVNWEHPTSRLVVNQMQTDGMNSAVTYGGLLFGWTGVGAWLLGMPKLMTMSGVGSAAATTGSFALNKNVTTEVRLITEVGGFIPTVGPAIGTANTIFDTVLFTTGSPSTQTSVSDNWK